MYWHDKKQTSIYKRLYFPYLLTLLLAAISAWWIGNLLFSNMLEKRLTEQLIHTTNILAKGEVPYTAGLLTTLERLVKADLVLLTTTGDSLRERTDDRIKSIVQRIEEQISGKRQSQTNQPLSIHVAHERNPYLVVIQDISSVRDSRIRKVVAISDLSDTRDVSYKMAGWLTLGVATGLLILSIVGRRISRSLTIPIAELASMASNIASGNRKVRAKIHSRDEIGDLANSLNIMTKKLEDYEQEIGDQSRMATLGEMTSRIAHEIRNPLTALKMQMQLLREGCDERQARLVDGLLKETGRLELIVNTTLQHRQRDKLQPRRTQLNDLINGIVDLVRPQFDHQRITLDCRLDPSLPELQLDRDMLKQVLFNLLLNAKDELPDGGNIRLETQLSGDGNFVITRVHDDGPGIEKSHRARLFEGTKSGKPGGFGLGLRLSRELIELHGGSIEVDESPLGGACFTITLPVTRTA